MHLSVEDAAEFRSIMAPTLEAYRILDELPEPRLPVVAPRTPDWRPAASENPHNGWYWRTEIATGKAGPLRGKRVAVKDNICVAGVPMMNGSALLEGYVPDIDATVVTRILEAGGTVMGKAACEDLCFSGASHTCVTGPIRNPHRPTHSAGGSSGSSAALVAEGAIEMALGGDQGGSIRTPSSWCGVYGLKPSWGLVPMTGAMPISYSVDHCGPICASVEDVALLLSVIAGHDGWDHRTIPAQVGDYMGALGAGAAGLRIGVLQEGFGHPESDPQADADDRARRGIGYIPQGRDVFPRMTVQENLAVGALIGASRRQHRADLVYQYFPILAERRRQMAGTLSGGQQQQLAIGRALIGGPDLILLDEPSEGVQPNIVQAIVRVLRRIRDELGTTIVFVEQNLETILTLADRCCVVEKGRVVDAIPPGAVTAENVRRHLLL